MNNFTIFGTLGLTYGQVESAIDSAQAAYAADLIRELWLAPGESSLYVVFGAVAPCVRIAHDFETESHHGPLLELWDLRNARGRVSCQ